MAVARQATVSTFEDDNVSAFSWTHTVNTGSDLALFVLIGQPYRNDLPDGATYNSVAMTLVDDQVGSGVYHCSTAYVLVNPSTGANTVYVDCTTLGGHYAGCLAISFSGVDQSTPTSGLQAGASSNVHGRDLDIVTTSGDYALCVGQIEPDCETELSFTAGTQEAEMENVGGGGVGGTATMGSEPAVGVSTNLAWGWTGNALNSYIAFCIDQAAAAGPGTQTGNMGDLAGAAARKFTGFRTQTGAI